MTDHAEPHPIRLVVRDDLRRSRLTVLLRLVLAVPHILWLWCFSLAAFFVAIVNWFATLITGRPQQGMHDFLARFTRYNLHLSAYLYVTANPFPGFVGEPGSYPIDVEVDEPTRQNRWVTGFRLPLALVAIVLAYVFGFLAFWVGFLAWFVALTIGRLPRGMRDLTAYALRYQAQTIGYLVLLTSRYPTLYARSEFLEATPAPQHPQ
jgi:amino acid transporter